MQSGHTGDSDNNDSVWYSSNIIKLYKYIFFENVQGRVGIVTDNLSKFLDKNWDTAIHIDMSKNAEQIHRGFVIM